MKNFFIITNPNKDPNLETTEKIEKYLISKGCKYKKTACEKFVDKELRRYTDPLSVPKEAECIIVVGGDGTLLHAARDLVSIKLPMIGVNSGKLGFLAEVEKNAIEKTLDQLIRDDYEIEPRMMLNGKLIRNKNVISESIALNDIIINRCGSLKVNDYKISINGNFLCIYSADGILVSTPTGATAYNLSAGGPIAEPSSNILIMTPICAHTLNTRSIVFSEDSEIEIEICEDKNGLEEGKVLSFDGDHSIDLRAGDKIIISKSILHTNIIKLSSMSFLELLRKKMG